MAHPSGPQGTSLSLALAADEVAHMLTGTPVFTICNSNNEFMLVSDPATGLRSLGLLYFRSENADAILSHVRTRQPVLGKGEKVVPITLDQLLGLGESICGISKETRYAVSGRFFIDLDLLEFIVAQEYTTTMGYDLHTDLYLRLCASSLLYRCPSHVAFTVYQMNLRSQLDPSSLIFSEDMRAKGSLAPFRKFMSLILDDREY